MTKILIKSLPIKALLVILCPTFLIKYIAVKKLLNINQQAKKDKISSLLTKLHNLYKMVNNVNNANDKTGGA
jgi:hypothetical protein